MKEIMDRLDFIKMKTICSTEHSIVEWEDKSNWEKIFLKTQLIQDYYVKYRMETTVLEEQ